MTIPTVIETARNALGLRTWSSLDNEVYPLLMSKEPHQFVKHCSTFVIPSSHEYYSNLLTLLQAWYVDHPAGNVETWDTTSRFDFIDSVNPNAWYIVDLRTEPDTNIKNRIELQNYHKLTDFMKGRCLMELYERCFGLVIFADSIADIPKTTQSVAVLSLTASTNPLEINTLCEFGTGRVPNDFVPIRSFNHSQDKLLVGYHRFCAYPTYCYFPSSD